MDLTRSADPLIQQVLSEGVARAHPAGIGLDLDEDGRIIDARGQAQAGVYAIGSIAQGAFGEAIAVPEIRARAAAIAALF